MFTDPGLGLEAAGSRPGDLGSWGQEAQPPPAVVGGSHFLEEPGLREGTGPRPQLWGMMSPLDEVTEPNGALSPGLPDTEAQGSRRAPAPSPRDLLASEDLEMFVLDLEDCDLLKSSRGQLTPMAGGLVCE